MTNQPPRLLALAAACLLAALVASGCRPEGSAEAPEAEPAAEPDQTYTVRGEVLAVPEARAERQLRVRHEAIPDFVGFDGEVVGMASMAMPFPLEQGVSLDGVEAGDAVELTFEVRWDGSPPLRIVALRPLPPGTELDFETAVPLPGEAEVEGAGSQPP